MKYLNISFVVLFVAIIGTGVAYGDELPIPKNGYSADVVMNVWDGKDGGRMTMEGTVNVSKDNKKERNEIVSMGHTSIMITRRDKGVTWVLMPERSMYLENPLGENDDKDPSLHLEEMNVKLTKIGKEKVNGINATKYEVVDLDADGGSSDVFLWLSKDNIPVKMEGTSLSGGEKTRFRRELNNVRIGNQNPKLFEVPAGYNKFNMPYMGGMGPGGMPPGGLSEEQIKQMQDNMKKKMEEMRKIYGK